MNNEITITMPYYEAPDMLRTHLGYWRLYPKWVKESISVILVDDGSFTFPARSVLDQIGDIGFPIQLYRIKENIPWNHGGARNLAFTHAPEGWCVLTDIDHVLPLESMCSLLTLSLSENKVYVPSRYLMKGALDWEEIEPHSDSFILTREMFWEVGGYDEQFSGYWNGVSQLFRKNLYKAFSEAVVVDSIHFLLFLNDVVKDANVTEWGRAKSEYDIHNNQKLLKKRNKLLKQDYKPKNHLQFDWERVL